MLSKRKASICGIGSFVFLLLVWLAPVAQAEQPFDFTLCSSATETLLSATDGLTVTGYDAKGIIMSNLANKVFDNMTAH
jgi:hypothetical protein